jgi:tRNA-2-methylthio-N6-dimethylallyladenosine synthase
MNRGYDTARFLGIVERARATIPGVNLTTDLIVGFPGESPKDFEDTLALLDEVRFGAAFVAMYSRRPGTASSRLPDDVPPAVKRDRLHRLLDRQRTLAREMNRRRIGDTVEVLIEGQARGGGAFGRTADHRAVIVDEPLVEGTWVAVKVERASADALRGRAIAPVAVEG